MNTLFDQITGKKTWLLEKWYQKTFYVSGIIYWIFFLLGVLIAIMDGNNY